MNWGSNVSPLSLQPDDGGEEEMRGRVCRILCVCVQMVCCRWNLEFVIVRILRWCFPFTDVLSMCTDIEFNVCGICVRLSTFSESFLGQNK